MDQPRYFSPEPHPGDRVTLKLPGLMKQEFTVLFIGPQSLKLRAANGKEAVVSRDKVRRQLNIPPSPARKPIRP